jgi:Sulfotransferase family
MPLSVDAAQPAEEPVKSLRPTAFPNVEILDVAMADVEGTGLREYFFDRMPASCERYDIAFAGWVVGRDEPLTLVHVQVVDGPILLRGELWPRQDVRTHFNNHPLAERSGFWVTVNLLTLPREVELSLWACGLDEKPIAEICRIKVRSTFPSAQVQKPLVPVMMCSLGRSGSTVLMRGLWQHPEFAIHSVFPFESQYFQYCVQAARVQSAMPTSPLQNYTNHFYLEQAVRPCPYFTRHEDLDDWFVRHHVPGTLSHWFDQGMAFYHQRAQAQGRQSARFLLEKSTVENPDFEVMRNAGHPPKIILLIRDPRDVTASWVKFGRKELDIEHLGTMFNRVVQIAARQDIESLTVRYERMMTAPREVTEEILTFCGADASADLINSVAHGIVLEDESIRHHRTTKSVSDSVGSWRRDLSPWQQAFCQKKLGAVIAALGYDAES